MDTDGYYEYLDFVSEEVTNQHGITNLIGIQNIYDDNDYWPRLAKLSFFDKLFNEHRYHFLYEIQGLSCQIHFGIINVMLFREKISTRKGKPNVYNHRYTFMIESTIHCIYSYWNRVALVLNTYLKKSKDLKQIYFSSVVQQLQVDYPILLENEFYTWICLIKKDLEALDRNEFAHNNSLIMQNFFATNINDDDFEYLLAMPEVLITQNKHVVDEISNLASLLECLEDINRK